MLNPLSSPLTLLVNMKRRLRSISHHVLHSDFLEECSLLRSDWTLKEQTLYTTVYLCVCVCETQKEREFFEGPSPDLEPISMQMLRPDLEEAAIVRCGQAGLA